MAPHTSARPTGVSASTGCFSDVGRCQGWLCRSQRAARLPGAQYTAGLLSRRWPEDHLYRCPVKARGLPGSLSATSTPEGTHVTLPCGFLGSQIAIFDIIYMNTESAISGQRKGPGAGRWACPFLDVYWPLSSPGPVCCPASAARRSMWYYPAVSGPELPEVPDGSLPLPWRCRLFGLDKTLRNCVAVF
jgi:hypothetical protein